METKLKILGFAGSLRIGSYNRALLRAATELLPDDATLEIFDINGIPPFNQDLEMDMPTKIKEFKAAPPGVLKNAIDFASRPYGDNPFNDKPVAIMSASVGMLGGARAQYHLRQTFIFLNMYPMNSPEVIVNFAQNKFDSNGRLIDEDTRKFLKRLLENLVIWTKRLRKQ